MKPLTFNPFPFPICGEAEKERIRRIAEELDAHRKRVQAQHPGLTLTGMYNVLEKLRHGEPLSPKDKVIHDQGLVSLLQQLHDDLDAAVFAAYGWQSLWQTNKFGRAGLIPDFKSGSLLIDDTAEPEDLARIAAAFSKQLDAEILQRLVHLNAQRAEDEKRGIIHWLRPEYQGRAQGAERREQEELALKPKKGAKPKSGTLRPAPRAKPTKQPWPKSLADRIRAVEAALHAAGVPVTAADLSKHFTSTKPAALQEILESLAALGRARVDGEKFAV